MMRTRMTSLTSFLRGCYLLSLLRPMLSESHWSGDLPSPLMAIFSLIFALILHRQLLLHRDTHSTIVHLPRAAIGSSDCLVHKGYSL